jgi:hypothetical protein
MDLILVATKWGGPPRGGLRSQGDPKLESVDRSGSGLPGEIELAISKLSAMARAGHL